MGCPFGGLAERDMGTGVKNVHFLGDVLNGCSLNIWEVTSIWKMVPFHVILYSHFSNWHCTSIWKLTNFTNYLRSIFFKFHCIHVMKYLACVGLLVTT